MRPSPTQRRSWFQAFSLFMRSPESAGIWKRLVVICGAYLPINIADDFLPFLGFADDLALPINIASAIWLWRKVRKYR